MAIARIGVVVLLALGASALLASPVLAEPEEILPPPPTAPAGGEAEGMPQGAPPTVQDAPAEPTVSEAASPLDWRGAPEGKLADRNGPRLPATAGRSETEARQRLEGWEVRIEKVVSARQYVGKVVDQHPDPGTTLARGEAVTVVIAVGGLPDRHHRSVPKVEGKAYTDAVPLLTRAGAYYAVPKTVAHTAAPGTIIDQMPRPGSIAKKATPVVLLISRGGGEAPAAPAAAMEELPPPPSGALPPDDMMPPTEVLPPPTVPAPAQPPSEHEAMPLEPPPSAPVPPAPMPPAPMPPLPAPGPRAPASPGMPLPLLGPVAPPPAPTPLKLSAPHLLTPEGGRAAPRRYGANFHWTAVPGAEAYEWELQVEVATDQWEAKDTQTVDGNRFRPKRLEKGRFRWRVRAIREGTEGAWSDFRRLYSY